MATALSIAALVLAAGALGVDEFPPVVAQLTAAIAAAETDRIAERNR